MRPNRRSVKLFRPKQSVARAGTIRYPRSTMALPRLYRLAQRTIVTAAGGATWEIIAPASGSKIRLLELTLTQVTAVAGTYGIGKPAAKGITPTTPVAFPCDRAGGADAVTAGAVAWGTGPTVPAAFRGRYTCPAAIGAGFDLKFGDVGRENGIEISPGESFVVWVLATAPVCDVTALIEEQA